MEEDKFQSSYLSLEGDLLNITWNFTGNVHKKESATIWEWDDATWVMSACFIIFGVSTLKLAVYFFSINAFII